MASTTSSEPSQAASDREADEVFAELVAHERERVAAEGANATEGADADGAAAKRAGASETGQPTSKGKPTLPRGSGGGRGR